MQKEIIINWLNEIADEEPKNFQEYFYDDVRNYVLQNDVFSDKSKIIFEFNNKQDVKKWLDKICGYLVMKLDVETIIDEYFQ